MTTPSYFCERLTSEDKVDCLSAATSSITMAARVRVKELVVERKIYNVKFRMEVARIFHEMHFVAGTSELVNHTDADVFEPVSVTYI